jgi:hypothetical protein
LDLRDADPHVRVDSDRHSAAETARDVNEGMCDLRLDADPTVGHTRWLKLDEAHFFW